MKQLKTTGLPCSQCTQTKISLPRNSSFSSPGSLILFCWCACILIFVSMLWLAPMETGSFVSPRPSPRGTSRGNKLSVSLGVSHNLEPRSPAARWKGYYFSASNRVRSGYEIRSVIRCFVKHPNSKIENPQKKLFAWRNLAQQICRTLIVHDLITCDSKVQ